MSSRSVKNSLSHMADMIFRRETGRVEPQVLSFVSDRKMVTCYNTNVSMFAKSRLASRTPKEVTYRRLTRSEISIFKLWIACFG